MTKRVAILHYASPPTVGGVEATIAHHARGLVTLGYQVRVISGSGASFDERIETHIDPLFSSSSSSVSTVKKELDQGLVSETFHALVTRQEAALREALEGCDLCIVHNVHTLNKNLPLTAALHRIREPRCIAWCHDLAWTNPQYLPELHEGYPWDLLRQKWPETTYITVSEARQAEMAALLEIPLEEITVITSGVNIADFLQWTPDMRIVEDRLHLLDADLLLLLPARITRRKNIELALRVLHELKRHDTGDYRLIVTGPPGPHNPLNPGYLGELLTLRSTLGLDDAVHFLYELSEPSFIPDDTTMANLYQIADALLFPSLQEGLGIPILEAGLVGLPIFCSDLPPFHQTGQEDVFFFDPGRDSAASIAAMIQTHLANSPRQRLKTRVRQTYRWEVILQQQLVPLLESRQDQQSTAGLQT
jgi:mannosylglucosylglycerate synthase